MDAIKFTGDKKAPMKTLLAAAERKFIDTNVAKIPKWIETYHLTLYYIAVVGGDNYFWVSCEK
ncbi:MAG: hypothetical protein ABFD79_18945 [Phycisphaerales bacterium]